MVSKIVFQAMTKTKWILLMSLIAALFVVQSSAQAQTKAEKAEARSELSVLGFQSWKTSRVDEAKTALAAAEKASGAGSGSASLKNADKKSDLLRSERFQSANKNNRSDQKIQQAHTNLEIAQELTVNDYFVLYLSQFKQKEAFLEAAKKLNPDEAADLMMAYQKRLADVDQEDSNSPVGLVHGSKF